MVLDLKSIFKGTAPCLIVAEIAQAHDGNINFAHSFVDLAADRGADAVKFQTHIAAEESTPSEPWRIRFSRQDDSRYEYWKRMEFSPDQWAALKTHAEDRGLLFLSSPFSHKAVDLLARIGLQCWKIPSGEVSNHPLLRHIVQQNGGIILSSGMSHWLELDAAVEILRSSSLGFGVIQCTSNYPCAPEVWGLNLVQEISRRYNCIAGLSDHSATVTAGVAAVALGAKIVEVHLTFDRGMFGPDTSSSLTGGELESLVQSIRLLERALGNPVDKDKVGQDQVGVRNTFQKNIVAEADLEAGTVLSLADLALKKAGGGLAPGDLKSVVGRKLNRKVLKNQPLSLEFLE